MKESKRVIFSAIAANVLIAIAKFVAAAFTGSSAMLTEGIHSIVDSGDGALLLLGERLSQRPADEQHPYGHGREIYFWSFVVAIMIFAVGGGISIYEGILRLMNPEPIKVPIWNYIVLGASFLIEGTSFVIALRHFHAQNKSGLTMFAAIKRSKNPSDFMVLFEDAAALAGILLAALGVSLELWTGNPMFDGAASIAIGLLLCAVAAMLVRETRGLLVGESLLPETAARIRRIVESDTAVERCAHPLSTYLGPDTVLINVAIQFRRSLETGAIERAIERIETSVRQEFPVVKHLFIALESLEPEASD